MRLTSIFTVLCLFAVVSINAQTKKEQDIKAIKSMCGCYEVGFNFAETFNYSEDSAYKASKVKNDKALEWVQLVEEDKNTIVMQHLLLVGTRNNKRIIKHWRQDWLYENRDFYLYNADNSWNYVRKPIKEVAGQWTQKVYQVDDSPRYEGSASWVHVDGKSYWENTTTAPLPRREATTRDDYNLTIRGNRHELTDYGWVHDQDNKKVIRKQGTEDVVLAEEKGWNTYKKVDDSRCKAAVKWWDENHVVWSNVRKSWDKVFAKKADLTLKSKVDDKRLFQHLFALEAGAKSKDIKAIITSYVK
ncbi:MAG: hypothetical protein HRU41_29565 [Saprospiraceae bacterium]|nr:hypothetical protein [Saprospiraceae bacterium]